MILLSVRAPIIIILLLVSLVMNSCGFQAVYDAQVNIPNGKWSKDNAVKFDVVISDTVSSCDFILNLRNTTDYRYSNLYVFLMTRFPNGNVTRDTIECILADHTGRWTGNGWGNTKDNQIVLKSGLQFPLSGNYEFFVQQAMRADTLTGITGVGLRIEKSE
jgi:gliding motility-associated lipoprotein GldH